MNLKDFSKRNRERCISGFKHAFKDWSVAEWTNAVCGEAGEAANVAKKIIRFRDGIAGNADTDTVENLRRKCREELADTIIYADLCIQMLGGDTSDEIAVKFKKTSEKIGYSEGES